MEFTKEQITDALKIAVDHSEGFAVSLLQREMGVPWKFALELMDELERLGFVGQWRSNRPRKVFLEKFSRKRRTFDTSCRKSRSNYNNIMDDSGTDPFEGGSVLSTSVMGRPVIELDKDKAIEVFRSSDSLRHAVMVLNQMGYAISKDTLLRRLKQWGVQTRRVQKWVLPN